MLRLPGSGDLGYTACLRGGTFRWCQRRFDAFVRQGGQSARDVAAAGLIAEGGGATVLATDGGPWFDLGRSPTSIGIVAASPAHRCALLDPAR